MDCFQRCCSGLKSEKQQQQQGGLGDELLGELGGTQDAPKKQSSVKGILGICAVVLLIVGGSVFHKQVAAALDIFVTWVQALGFFAPVILAGAIVFLQMVMMPTFPLMVGAGIIFPKIFGYFFGQVVGVLSVFGGLWLGSMITFQLGRTCFREWAEEELKQYAWMEVVNAMIKEQGWKIILLARMSPLLPAEVFTYACSLTPLTLCDFGIGCMGSIVPTCMWVCGSASAGQAVNDASASLDPAAKKHQMRVNISFWCFNIVFLGLLTYVLWSGVQKYKAKAGTHVEDHVQEKHADLEESMRRVVSEQLLKNVTRPPPLKRGSSNNSDRNSVRSQA